MKAMVSHFGVNPIYIKRQRASGWPDIHPEDYCHRCGNRNAGSWHADSSLWRVALEGLGCEETILCPSCFVEGVEKAMGPGAHWEMRLNIAPVSASTSGEA